MSVPSILARRENLIANSKHLRHRAIDLIKQAAPEAINRSSVGSMLSAAIANDSPSFATQQARGKRLLRNAEEDLAKEIGRHAMEARGLQTVADFLANKITRIPMDSTVSDEIRASAEMAKNAAASGTITQSSIDHLQGLYERASKEYLKAVTDASGWIRRNLSSAKASFWFEQQKFWKAQIKLLDRGAVIREPGKTRDHCFQKFNRISKLADRFRKAHSSVYHNRSGYKAMTNARPLRGRV